MSKGRVIRVYETGTMLAGIVVRPIYRRADGTGFTFPDPIEIRAEDEPYLMEALEGALRRVAKERPE